jgi:hypothetical protein
MRTTVSVPDELLESAKEQAKARGVTLSDVVADALRGHLSETAARAVPEFRLHTVRGKLVNPDVDLDRTSALVVDEDETAYGRR